MLPLPTKATTEEKTNSCRDGRRPKDHKLFTEILIHASRRIISTQVAKRRQENFEWEEVIGSLNSAQSK